MKETVISASAFKARCLQLLDEVQRTRVPIVISKRGRPVARIVPAEDEPAPSLFGCLKGTVKILGDIVGSTGVEWEADA